MSNSIANTVTTNILPVQALYDPTTLAFQTFIGPAGLPFTSAAGGVSSVDVSGGTTGLTTSGGPIVSSGTITPAGTLSVSNGGTGATTSAGAIANILPSQTGNSGKYLTTDGTTTSWSTAGGGLTVTDDTTTNATRFLTFTSASSGTITSENVASTKLTFNPSSGTLSSTTFVGALTGNASTATSATTATNLAGGTAGALAYQASAGSTTFLTAGSNGQYLTLTAGVPTWTSLTPVSSFSAGTTGLTPSTATTGAVTLAGTLNVANGGTGVTSSSGASSVVLRDANSNITGNILFSGFTNTTASGSTTTLTASSTPNWVLTGSGGQTFQLPNATTLTTGIIYSFNNNQTSGAITVNNASGTLVVSVPSGGYVVLTLLTNGTSAGTWDYHFQAPSNVSWSTNTFSYSGSITSATWNATAIGAIYGGTGQTAYTTGDILYASATNTLSKLGVGSTGQVLTVVGGVPAWSASTGASITDDTTTNATRYISFTSATTGALSTIYTSSTKLQYNPSTGTLTTTAFSGSGSNLTFGTGTLSLAGNVTHSGSFTQTITATANTSVTLPTSGTIISSVTALSGAVTGTPSSTTYLRGDGTWSTPSSGVSLSAANTWTATQTFNGSSSTFALSILDANETVNVVASAPSATTNFYIQSGGVQYYTSNAANNWTLNIAFSSGTSLNTALSTGQSVTFTLVTTQGSTAYYNNAVTIDGTSVTPKWIGGAPTAGNASGLDVYRFAVVKTASATYTVLASLTQYK